MTKNLTTGSVSKTLMLFSLPLLLSTLLQQFYNVADSMIVGRFVGESGLAAIGAAYPITLFIVAVGTGTSMGCSVVLSMLFGASRRDRYSTASCTALIAFSALGVILSVAGVLLSRPVMLLLNASDDIIGDASAYLAVYAVGAFAMLLYNAASGIFIGFGDSKTPLFLLFVSSVVNVVLDYIVVRFFDGGVIGAAWATTVSQYLSALLGVVLLVNRLKNISGGPVKVQFDRSILKDISVAAIPCILQQGSVALTAAVIQSLLNTFSTAVIAGFEVGQKLHTFFYMCINTLGNAYSTFTAQCLGAGKHKRIREGFRVTLLIALGCVVVVIALFQLLPSQLVELFIDRDASPDVVQIGIQFLRTISPLYLLICYIVATGGLLRGTGRSVTFFVESILEFTVRIVMCFVLSKAWNSHTGVLWAWYFGSSSGFLMCLALSLHIFRTQLKPNPAKPEQLCGE